MSATPDMKSPSHLDYLPVIGGTQTTAGKTWRNAQWSRYYRATHVAVARDLLRGTARGCVLDVGTSHGLWYPFLKALGFQRILGVEVDAGRAALARAAGYDEVFNCDAADTPLSGESIDVAISSGVFVHILRIEDKIRVIQKVEALLKRGGVFVVNCTSARAAFGSDNFCVVEHCSFMSVHDFLSLFQKHTQLRILDIRPTYFHWRGMRKPWWLRVLRGSIVIPGMPYVLAWIDRNYTARRFDLDASDTFFVKLVK